MALMFAAPQVRRQVMDFIYLAVVIGFLLITLALVKGCSVLERKK
jgi:uncharacterized membrane protein